jgi:hypothetical protein
MGQKAYVLAAPFTASIGLLRRCTAIIFAKKASAILKYVFCNRFFAVAWGKFHF